MAETETASAMRVDHYFLFPLNIKDAKNPNISAAEIPAAAEQRGPVSAPMSPCLSTDSRTPRAIRFPKPESGVVAPAPANSIIFSYMHKAPRMTPQTTNPTRILAGVSLVLSSNICAITQKAPPTVNAKKSFKKMFIP